MKFIHRRYTVVAAAAADSGSCRENSRWADETEEAEAKAQAVPFHWVWATWVTECRGATRSGCLRLPCSRNKIPHRRHPQADLTKGKTVGHPPSPPLVDVRKWKWRKKKIRPWQPTNWRKSVPAGWVRRSWLSVVVAVVEAPGQCGV